VARTDGQSEPDAVVVILEEEEAASVPVSERAEQVARAAAALSLRGAERRLDRVGVSVAAPLLRGGPLTRNWRRVVAPASADNLQERREAVDRAGERLRGDRRVRRSHRGRC